LRDAACLRAARLTNSGANDDANGGDANDAANTNGASDGGASVDDANTSVAGANDAVR
jgi:hypothetical protein